MITYPFSQISIKEKNICIRGRGEPIRKSFKMQRLEFGTCNLLDVNYITLTKLDESFIKIYNDIFKSRLIFMVKQIQHQIFFFDLHIKKVWIYYGTSNRFLNGKPYIQMAMHS